MAAIAARPNATMCNTRAYVIHFTTTSGIWMGKSLPTSLLMSERIRFSPSCIYQDWNIRLTQFITNRCIRACCATIQYHTISKSTKSDVSALTFGCKTSLEEEYTLKVRNGERNNCEENGCDQSGQETRSCRFYDGHLSSLSRYQDK